MTSCRLELKTVVQVVLSAKRPDKVVKEIQQYVEAMLRSSLSHKDEAKLQAALSQDQEKKVTENRNVG